MIGEVQMIVGKPSVTDQNFRGHCLYELESAFEEPYKRPSQRMEVVGNVAEKFFMRSFNKKV